SALMVLTMFTALVPAASAVTTTQVSAPYEFIGIVNETAANTGAGKYFEMNATSRDNPSLLYFDLADMEGNEKLYINTGTSDKMTLKKGSDNLTYTTTPWKDPDTKKPIVAWLGEKYFVVSNESGKWILSRFIVDEDNSDDYLLRVGDSLTLAEGWEIKALEIDVDGKKAWLSLTKDGEEIANKVVKETEYFVYEKDLGRGTNNKDEVMNFTVDTVFAGMNTNLVKIKNIDLISDEPLELKSGSDKPYSDYKMTVNKPNIIVKVNSDVSLTEDGVIDILGGRFQIRVTKDEKMAAIVKTVTEPGIYEFIGIVNETAANTGAGKYFEMNATSRDNPSLLYFDLADMEGNEKLYINTGTSDKMTLKKGSDNLTYTTTPWKDPDTKKPIVAWLGEKYFVVSNESGKWILSRFIVDEDNSDDYLLRVGDSLTLAEGWEIKALEIDVDGKKAWLSLTKDGEEIANKVVKETEYFVYEKDLGRGTNNKDEVMNFTVDTVFAGMNTNLVKIKNIDLISDEPLELKSGSDKPYSDYKMTVNKPNIIVKVNSDVSLTEDGVIDILGGRMQIRVTKDEKMAAIVKTVEIGGGETPTKTAVPTETATEVGTEEGTEAGTEDGTEAPTEEPTEVPTEVPTEEPTKEPGFEAVFAIAGLLAVAYLVLRKRE
ncbi:MAG: PGF-CTERM sorting domain-containing protein, partial [ANME-2 cluster archaeon]|nr:PGF-CTERM sorting domain-containing protein [ANME-2 cluster archaeon]